MSQQPAENAMSRLRSKIAEALAKAGVVMQAEIKLQLSKSISPSKPGTPPAVVTGALRQSVQVDLTDIRHPRVPQVAIGPDLVRVPYARIHEFGGDTGTVTLPARPYIAPAIVLARRKINRIMRGLR